MIIGSEEAVGELWGAAQGQRYPPEGLAEKVAHALFPRTTPRSGGLTPQRDHLYGASGVPQTQVWLWGYGAP